ncbi:hypothetical protein D7X30_02485 [Corallococcus sp. AB011P]|uniref:hypothetical protein n=1 Tax=Corallococcus sp. AB011P TaxID=2316735 RepID=UPI000EA00E74|nr:hypothetical protein [Corallococcus sp. AB011P]RKG62208.1 hypothetical protein D7X30_02485 [Corallococcus sp. AB011P]
MLHRHLKPEEAGLLEWEEVPPAEGQGVAQRRIRRPEWPAESSTPPPRKPVLERFLHIPMARERRPEVVPDKSQSAGARGPRTRGWPYFVLVSALAVGIFGAKVLGW